MLGPTVVGTSEGGRLGLEFASGLACVVRLPDGGTVGFSVGAFVGNAVGLMLGSSVG